MKHDRRRVALAYSGGLDTTACIPYLREEMGATWIVAVAVDLGQGDELEPLRLKALAAGADEAIVVDARERFISEYGFPALTANALHSGKYPLSSALGRPVITDVVVEAAHRYGCGSVAHGATGKGNDQVRFDLGIRLLDPELHILAPARRWTFTRAETVDYITRRGIPAHVTAEKPWAVDLNLLGRNVEAGPIEDLSWEPSEEVWAMTADPSTVESAPQHLAIDFVDGLPVGLDGTRLAPLDLVERLNGIAGRHGIGRIDVIEDRIVGVKSRELYEAPAVTVLLEAHRELEQLTLPHDVLRFKAGVELLYADYVYNGLWHSPMREYLASFVAHTQQGLTGTITVRLHRGTATTVARQSVASLYARPLVTYGQGCTFPSEHSEGFIEIYGLADGLWRQVRARQSPAPATRTLLDSVTHLGAEDLDQGDLDPTLAAGAIR